MLEKLKTFIEQLKANQRISSYSEADTILAIIQPLLGCLGWDRDNPDEVKPQYQVENGFVDFSLKLNNIDVIFLEVKRTGEDLDKENYQNQLLRYAFGKGVRLAILTNGMTWWFYLPMKEVDWKKRKFYSIDIKKQDSADVVSKFVDLLSKDNVQSGKAIQHADLIYKGRVKKQAIENTLPEAWNKIISEQDDLLIELIAETTESICGHKPDVDIVKRFLGNYRDNILIALEHITTSKKEPTLHKISDDIKPISSLNDSSYIERYRRGLKNPDSLISKIRKFIKEKGSVSDKDLRRTCVKEFGCRSETSGSIGACVKVLENDGYIKVNGRGDSKRLFIK
jgi:predicted type IV restriction endonuclease